MGSSSSKNTTCFLVLLMLLFIMQYAKTTHCATNIPFNVIVAKDNSGNFTTVSDAVKAAPKNSKTRYMIRIKPGRYKERVEIESDLTYISLIGDDVTTTIITFDRSNGSGFKTNETGTLSVMGQGFVAKSLTIENSAGPQNHQAAALYNTADQSAFYNCIFLGYQDTLYAKENRQFYKDCKIYGTVDFIFGHAKGVFQDCHIYARPETLITITAQNRASDSEVNGFSFQGCHVEAAPGLTPPQRANLRVFLGRPWDRYSTVIFMQSILDDIVDPQGWTEWPGVPVDHLHYAEYDNSGLGADTSKRVNWKGYHVVKKWIEADWFTVAKFINGNSWLPETGVPYRGGLRSVS